MAGERQFNKSKVFRPFLVEDAEYEGFFEMPCIFTSDMLPEKVISFSKAMAKNFHDYECWVHFYEDDFRFERLWHNPGAYLTKLKKFRGIISPDFSIYRNMPFAMQAWNAYRGRALSEWLYKNGVEIIPNVRYNDERTYLFCFDGIEKNKTIAIGTHGCIKKRDDRAYFKKGLKILVEKLSPKNIIVYGAAPKEIFGIYKEMGINIISFESEFALSRKAVKP